MELDSGEYVFIEPRDSGSRMDNLKLEKVFDPFFSTKFMGRGLVLAVVPGIVRAHDGGFT